MKRGFANAFAACMVILLVGELQVFASQTQAETTISNDADAFAENHWHPETWKADFWTGTSKWHKCSMNNELVYTRFAGWNGFNSWGNTEYVQGRDPWRNHTKSTRAVKLSTAQSLTVTLRISEAKVDTALGVANAYVDFWVNFSEPVGDYGLRWAELIVYLKTEKGMLYPFQEQGTFGSRICHDGNLTWYMVSYSCVGAESQWSTRTITVDYLIEKLVQIYNVNVSMGTVSGLAFGVEGAQGEMAAEWSYLSYEYPL